MEEFFGLLVIAGLASSHLAALGFGFYRGYIQGTKNSDAEWEKLPSYQRYQKMNQDKESNHGTTAS